MLRNEEKMYYLHKIKEIWQKSNKTEKDFEHIENLLDCYDFIFHVKDPSPEEVEIEDMINSIYF